MMFIINLTIALILFTVEAMKEMDDRKTVNCEVKAYLTLYCFLVSVLGQKTKFSVNFSLIKAFYCWMNAMCFNIWNKFATMQRQSIDDRKNFIRLSEKYLYFHTCLLSVDLF